ncbi:MAG: hypothetical protein ABJA66_03150 [Actinomycetota bacterium]
MKIKLKILSVLGFILFSVFSIYANVSLPDVLGSSMVLEQNQKVPVWGTAEPGETVVVTFQKQKLTVVADAKGKWQVGERRNSLE